MLKICFSKFVIICLDIWYTTLRFCSYYHPVCFKELFGGGGLHDQGDRRGHVPAHLRVLLLYHHRSTDTFEMDGVGNYNKGKVFGSEAYL